MGEDTLHSQSTQFEILQNHSDLKISTDNHTIDTGCPKTHARLSLCCKTSVEFDYYIKSGKKWFCHFDDDNYVYIPRLVDVLQRFDHRKEWYLGRHTEGRENVVYKVSDHAVVTYSFRFALFGAGMCLSKSLAHKINPYAGKGKFSDVCKDINQNDDVTMGFLVELYGGQVLTEVDEFHSQNDNMRAIPSFTYRDQISFGFFHGNVLSVPGFDLKLDPTRFLSLHCFFYPHAKFCSKATKTMESSQFNVSSSVGALGPLLRNHGNDE